MSYSSQETIDREVYSCCWGIIPMQEKSLKLLGFRFENIFDNMPHRVKLPVGWKIKETSRNNLLIFDESDLARGYIEETKLPQEHPQKLYALLKLFK